MVALLYGECTVNAQFRRGGAVRQELSHDLGALLYLLVDLVFTHTEHSVQNSVLDINIQTLELRVASIFHELGLSLLRAQTLPYLIVFVDDTLAVRHLHA